MLLVLFCISQLLTFEKKRELILTRQGKIIRGKLTTTEMAKAKEEGGKREKWISRKIEGEREGQMEVIMEEEEG